MDMRKDTTAFRKRFEAWKRGEKPYEAGLKKYADGKVDLLDNPTNATLNDDGTFVDDYTKVWDDLVITNKGPKVIPGQLHKYQEPFDDYKFFNAITAGGLNNLSPSLWAGRIQDLYNGELTADSWFNGNYGVLPRWYAQEHPKQALGANLLFDFWTLGGPLLLKNAGEYALLANAGKNAANKYTFKFDLPESRPVEPPRYANLKSPEYPNEPFDPSIDLDAGLHDKGPYGLLHGKDYVGTHYVNLLRGYRSDPLDASVVFERPYKLIKPVDTAKKHESYWYYFRPSKNTKSYSYKFNTSAEDVPEEVYTGKNATEAISKDELGQRKWEILNPEILPSKIKELPARIKYRPPVYDETYVDRNGNVNMRNITTAVKEFYKTHPNARPYKSITNSSGNLYDHTKAVIESALNIPIPEGYTRLELVLSALFHDIGKVFEPGKSHQTVSVEMLEDAGIKLPESVKKAIGQHMSGKLNLADPLSKALHFADVARGQHYDEAAFNYPHLLYNYEKPSLNIERIPIREELKTRINPWLKARGYETIPLDATEEEAWRMLEERVAHHRTLLRGVRDPYKKHTADPDDERNAENVIKYLMDNYGMTRELAMSDDAANLRLEYAGTTIPLDPTGSGRSNLYHTPRREGLTKHESTSYSRAIGADKNKQDGLYVSTSDEVTNTYATTSVDRPSTGYMVMFPKLERRPGESMSEYLLRGDWELYDTDKLMGGGPLGTGSMYEGPYRLLTGRSLLSDMIKEGVIKPTFKSNDENIVKPEDKGGSEYIGGRVVFHPSYQYASLVMDNVNKYLQELGVDFLLDKTPNGSIMFPKQMEKLEGKLFLLSLIKNNLTKTNDFNYLNYDPNTALYIYDVTDDIANEGFMSRKSYFETIPNEELNSIRDYVAALEDPEYVKYMFGDDIFEKSWNFKGTFPKKQLSLLKDLGYITNKQIAAAKKAYYRKGDPLKYLNIDKTANKILSDFLKSVKGKKAKSFKIDIKSVKATPQLMIKFMRDKGVLPRYEIEGFGDNNLYAVKAPTKNKTKNKPLKQEIYGYILGEKGQKVVLTKENIGFKETRRGARDIGDRTNNKTTRKTLRTVGAVTAAGSATLKPRRKKE